MVDPTTSQGTGGPPPDSARGDALLRRLERPFREGAAELGLEPDRLAPELGRIYLPLAAWIEARRRGAPLLLGLNGAQGSGKSTLAALLQRVLEVGFGLRVAVLSLDDLYLTRAQREDLSRRVHPLLLTRGVPGTHDVDLGVALLRDLKGGASRALPAFDKARDDRRPEEAWPRFEGPADVILFEGWCVGARPQAAEDLVAPVNALEAEADPDGSWRRHVNDQLAGPYASLFGLLDALVMLKAPSFDHVFAWRSLQERRLAASQGTAAAKAPGLMDEARLRRFIMHYERLTRAMLRDLPERADLVLPLREDHQIEGLLVRATGPR